MNNTEAELVDNPYYYIRDVAQFNIPTLLDVRTYGDRLLIVFDKGEIRRFIVVIYNSVALFTKKL